MDRKVYWRCFHCGETFTKAQERWAREHFGRDEGELPVCQMRVPGEHHLLTALRKAQDELARFYAEDTDLMRAIYSMQAEHAAALRREEERGYEKAVADVRAEQADLLRALKETWRVLRAAGTLNLTNGVQLGQMSWYVKICDAEELSDAAIAEIEGSPDPDEPAPVTAPLGLAGSQ